MPEQQNIEFPKPTKRTVYTEGYETPVVSLDEHIAEYVPYFIDGVRHAVYLIETIDTIPEGVIESNPVEK